MRFKQITFTITRALPLYPISKDKADEYANVKPSASCTIEFDADDEVDVSKANFETAKKIVNEALDHAQSVAFNSVAAFSKEFRELYRGKTK